MSRTRIKFCGIRRQQDVRTAVDLGVDALGLVFVEGSRRHVTPQAGARLRRAVPAFVSVVALLLDPEPELVRAVIDTVRPDLLQFHGREDPAFCAGFGMPYVKAVAMADPANLRREARRHRGCSGLLLDSHAAGGMGGRGEAFDWSTVGSVRQPLILAGGLGPQTVARGIRMVRPYAVDVSSGIEARPGIKDPDKMAAFVDAVQRADRALRRSANQ
ncbi:MAG: phosphoribosylanthranilate isomerase [Nevskiales bacterium]|nr:phosphoribosylanthranilate isomerase [Nevskiales bacterium]